MWHLATGQSRWQWGLQLATDMGAHTQTEDEAKLLQNWSFPNTGPEYYFTSTSSTLEQLLWPQWGYS